MIWATGFRTNDFMFPMEITGQDGARLRDAWSGGAHAHLGMTRAGLPEHVRDVRAEHQHLWRLDHRLPRGPGGIHPPGGAGTCAPGRGRDRGPPRGRGRERPRAAGPLRRDGLDRVRLLVSRRAAAGSSRTGPVTCASIWIRPGSWSRTSSASCRSPTASPRLALRERRGSGDHARLRNRGGGLGGVRAREQALGGPVGECAAARGGRQGPLDEDQASRPRSRSSSTPSWTGTSRPSPRRMSMAARCTCREARCSAARAP